MKITRFHRATTTLLKLLKNTKTDLRKNIAAHVLLRICWLCVLVWTEKLTLNKGTAETCLFCLVVFWYWLLVEKCTMSWMTC